jgi:DUF971 family protein
MSELRPVQLQRTESGALVIEWSDGCVQEIPLRNLRSACPCARCRAEELQPKKPGGLLPVLTSAQARPLVIERMTPIGNYAYSIEFSDGHNSGIYSFEFLRQLGQSSAN